jgi:hypothetical protein
MAVLSEVIDGTTPITETHPEEKRAAIGTTWDSASDLTLKQVSDGLIAEHSSAGAHSNDIIDQAQMALTSAGTSNGLATRYQEFNAEHNASDGTHKTSVAIITSQTQVNLGTAGSASGDATRYNEFSAEHVYTTGQHNVPQATGTGDAVRWDDWSQEHSNAGAHSNDIIDQAQMALTAASAATGEAVRHDEFSAQHTASTGAHRADVEIITAQAQVNLGSAASTSGDAVRYDEWNTHTHTVYTCLYAERAESTSDNTSAAALHQFKKSDANTDTMTAIRVAFYKRSDIDGLRLTGYKTNESSTYNDAYIQIYCGGLSSNEQVTAGAAADFELTIDISSLSDDTHYEIQVNMYWSTAHAMGDSVTLDYPQVWGLAVGATPS